MLEIRRGGERAPAGRRPRARHRRRTHQGASLRRQRHDGQAAGGARRLAVAADAQRRPTSQAEHLAAQTTGACSCYAAVT